MKGDNLKSIQVIKEIKLDNIRNLIRAAFLVGQMEGLKGNSLTNLQTRDNREFFVELLTSDKL